MRPALAEFNADALRLAGQIGPLWAWIADNVEGCGDCVISGRGELERAILARYGKLSEMQAVAAVGLLVAIDLVAAVV